MARKLTGNCRIDYNSGREDGYKIGYGSGYKDGGEKAILYARHLAVLPLYNIVQNFLDDEELQNQIVTAYAREQDRIYGEEFFGNTDRVLQALHGVKRIYQEVGLNDEGFDFEIRQEDW